MAERTLSTNDMTNLSAIFKRAVKKVWITASPYDDAEKVKTTLRYMHYAPRADNAARLSAFIAAQTEPNVVPLDAAAA